MRRLGIAALTLAVASLGLACYAWYFAHYQSLDTLVLRCKDFTPSPVDCDSAAPPAAWPWFLAPLLLSALGIWSLRRDRLRAPELTRGVS